VGVFQRQQRVLKSGTIQSNPSSCYKLSTNPVVCLSGIPNKTFKIRRVSIAASLNCRHRSPLPVGSGDQILSGSNQIDSKPRSFNAVL